MRDEIPLFDRAMKLLGNPYVLVIAGLVAVTVLLGKATGEAKKFNHEFLHIKQLNLDKNQKDLKSYKALIADSAFETGKSLVDTTKAYYDIQSALGFYGKDAKSVFKSVAKFSTATGAELNDSINATTKAIKAFGLQASDTDMLLASNAKTVQVGITNFRELAKVQTEYAGAASGAGQNVDSANKLFAAFTSIAKDSAQAATLTKTAFQGLTQDATVKGLKKIGISLYDTDGNLRNIESILRDVDSKFKNMSSRQIDKLINKIGGPEGLRALLTKVKNGSEDLFKTFEAFDASEFDLDKALKNAQGDVTVLSGLVKNRFNVIMAKLGSKILPLVLKVLVKTNKILTYVYKNGKRIFQMIKDLTIAFLSFKATNFLLNRGISKLSSLFSIGLYGGIKKSASALKSFNAAIKANAIGLIVSAISVMVSKLSQARAELDKFTNDSIEKGKQFQKNVANIQNPTDLDRDLLNSKGVTGRQIEDVLSRTKARLTELEDIKSKLKAQLNRSNPKNSVAISTELAELQKVKNPTVDQNIKIAELSFKLNPSNRTGNLNIDNILKDRKELESLRKLTNPDYVQTQRIKQLEFNIIENTKELTKGFDIKKLRSLIDKNKHILDELKKRGVDITDDSLKEDSKKGSDYGISDVETSARSPKTIIIKEIVMHQGDINVDKTKFNQMSAEEMEEFFEEMMMRVIRNAELS